MGSSCSKGGQNDRPDRVLNSESETQFYSQTCLSDGFSISLDCFSITTKRLSAKSYSVAKGCKSALVTKIKLEVNNSMMTKAKSVLHMPVIRFSDVEVKVQLPELLPLNLWTGTQTIFSFIYHNTPEDSEVTLTGKVGTKSISIQQTIEKDFKLNTEELAQLNKLLEKEIRRFKKHISRDLALTEEEEEKETADAKKAEDDEEEEVDEDEENGRRDSQARRPIPNAESPYSGLAYIDDTTDSDNASCKERTREKQSKPRRKDTPSHNITFIPRNDSKISSYSQSRQRLGKDLLEEEQEPDSREEATDLGLMEDDLFRGQTGAHFEALDLSHGQIYKHKRKDSLRVDCSGMDVQASLSRSFNNLRELKDDPPEVMNLSPISLRAEPRFKRKKVSIGSKLSKLTFRDITQPGQKMEMRAVSSLSSFGQEFGHDADDEGESGCDVIRKSDDRRANKESVKKETAVKEFDKQQNPTQQEEYSNSSYKNHAKNNTEGTLKNSTPESMVAGSNKDNVCSDMVNKETVKSEPQLKLGVRSTKNKSKNDKGSTTGPLKDVALTTEMNEAQTIDEHDQGSQTDNFLRQENDHHTNSSITDDNSSDADKVLKENVLNNSDDCVQETGMTEKQIKSPPQEIGSGFHEDISNSQTKTTRSMTISEAVRPRSLTCTRRKAPSLDEKNWIPTKTVETETRASPLHAFAEKKDQSLNTGENV